MDLFNLFANVKLNASDYEIGIGKVKASTVAVGHLMADFVKTAASIGPSLAKIGLAYNMQMEDYTTNFRVMLGSMEAAEEKVKELKTMAAKTPFAMEDLADATQTLLAFGVASSKTTSVMSRLGDISLGNAQRMSSLSNAYGKAAAQGKLTGEVVQMMVDAGFNPLLQISEATGESMENLQKRMSAGAVSVDELDLALRRATSEGGQFYRGMEEASKTLSGQLSTLEDNWNAFLGEAMSPVNEQLSSKIMPAAIASLDRLSNALFGVSEDAETAKKSLFFDPAGNPTDPQQNLLTWMDDLMKKWTDGETEDTSTVQSFVDTFNQNTNAIKDALVARIEDMSNPMSEEEIQEAQLKIAEIGRMQTRVEELLQKRAGGYITAEEEAELNSIIGTLKTMQTELEAAAAFKDNIVSPWERLVASAGDFSADAIDDLADFFEWCASDDGENGAKVLRVMTSALGALVGMRFGPVGAALGIVAANIDSLAEKAKGLYDWIKKLTDWSWDQSWATIRIPREADGPTLRDSVTNLWNSWTGGSNQTGTPTTGDGTSGSYIGGRPTTGGDINGMTQATMQVKAMGTQMWNGSRKQAKSTAIDYDRLGESVARAIANSGIGFSVGERQLAVATADANSRAINARQRDINIGKVRF